MTPIKDIAFIAGLLEGEGHFVAGNGKYFCPRLGVTSTDLDTIEKFRRIVKAKTKIKVEDRSQIKPNWKTIYSTNIYSSDAIQWMMTIYSFMNSRRKERIRAILGMWKGLIPIHKLPIYTRYSTHRGARVGKIKQAILSIDFSDI